MAERVPDHQQIRGSASLYASRTLTIYTNTSVFAARHITSSRQRRRRWHGCKSERNEAVSLKTRWFRRAHFRGGEAAHACERFEPEHRPRRSPCRTRAQSRRANASRGPSPDWHRAARRSSPRCRTSSPHTQLTARGCRSDAVYTPAACSCESRRTTRLIPARTLNARVGGWLSCLTNSSAPTMRSSDR